MNQGKAEILAKAAELLDLSGVCQNHAAKVLEYKRKLDSRELVISVIGQFKRGKSTFINSILKVKFYLWGLCP